MVKLVKDRSHRLDAVRKIIAEQRIANQEQLLDGLESAGIVITQATLSRDLKSLRVNKVSDGASGYYYSLPSPEDYDNLIPLYVQDIKRGYLSMEFSGSLCIISTLVGHANPVAAAIDRIGFEEVLGTVAGDDTILAVLREGYIREDFQRSFNHVLDKGSRE
jgi:transcriptional regulator of arginine metabolism